jgi:hypothetical protein
MTQFYCSSLCFELPIIKDVISPDMAPGDGAGLTRA